MRYPSIARKSYTKAFVCLAYIPRPLTVDKNYAVSTMAPFHTVRDLSCT